MLLPYNCVVVTKTYYTQMMKTYKTAAPIKLELFRKKNTENYLSFKNVIDIQLLKKIQIYIV